MDSRSFAGFGGAPPPGLPGEVSALMGAAVGTAQTVQGSRQADRPPLSAGGDVAYAQSMQASLQDSSLMLRYRDGDQSAFETLFRRHNDALYRYLLRLSGNRAVAEDLYQEVWSRIIKARHRYRPSAKFSTYLYRIAHNCFIDHTRRNRRFVATEHADPECLVDAGPTPEESAERIGLRRRLLAALAELPDEQRDAFLLHQEAGLNVDEIATTTGVNRETAKSRLRYANQKLKAALTGSDTSRSASARGL